MRLVTGLKVLAFGTVIVMASACRDGDGDLSSFNLDSAQNSPPTISGTPRTKTRAGERYEFTPRATDPERERLRFSVANQPTWLAFDPASGRLTGTPRASDLGRFSGVTISVTDGITQKALEPFTILVEGVSATDEPPPVTPPDTPSAGGPFRFAEIPEFVFVRGYRETEHLGIFHLDTRNRWTPGDIDNKSGWTPRVATELTRVSGSLDGIEYDSATGILHYDGTGKGTQTARVRLTAPSQSVNSQEFNIRVLQPTIAWGAGAAQRFPDIGFDSSTTSWKEMQRRLHTGAPYDAPNVLIVTPGTYAEDFYLTVGLLNLYVIGEPGSRPTLAHDNLNLDDLETGYLKNLEFDGTTVNSSSNLRTTPVNLYVTQVHQHDSVRDTNGFKAPSGSPAATSSWRYWFWNFHGSQMGGQGNMRHQMYIEGRLDSRLLINNIRVTGTKECSAVKSTRSFVTIRNSYLSAMLDESNLAAGLRSDKLIDVASAADVVIYNNDLVGTFSKERWGVSNGLIYFRARRTFWGADSPAYPNLSLDPPLSSVRPGFAPEGFTAGPETFVNPAFWEVVRSYDIKDPANPYSLKKFVSYNRFRWIDDDGRRQSAFRDDGTAPRGEIYQGSMEEIWGTIPANWVERSVTFFANNRYDGWQEPDLQYPLRWFDLDNHPDSSLVTRTGPGPWPFPPPPRTVVAVGGEQKPGAQQSPIEMPGWFRF